MGSWGSGRARFDASVGCPRLGFAFTSGYVPRAALERWRSPLAAGAAPPDVGGPVRGARVARGQPRKVSDANPTVHRLRFGGSSHQDNCAFRLNTSPLRHGA